MRIAKLKLRNFRQFKDFEIDFTNPSTGEPVETSCCIGANGTGKSTIMGLLVQAVNARNLQSIPDKGNLEPGSVAAVKLWSEEAEMWVLSTPQSTAHLSPDVEQSEPWKKLWDPNTSTTWNRTFSQTLWTPLHKAYADRNGTQAKFALKNSSNDLLIYAPPDGKSLSAGALPSSNLNKATGYFKQVPYYHVTSYDSVQNFWTFLIYQIAKRENDEKEFMKRPEIKQLKVIDAEALFAKQFPEILSTLSAHWNLILDKAGLVFDIENAVIPVQLNDNLQAYVKSKVSNQRVTYNQLSTGIRNFLFRIGHIHSLYFNREIKRGFLFVDEPELSLFPDVLYELIETYINLTQNTQAFFATHSPIVASQFQPFERVIFEFDDKGYVRARKGVAPKGDDPNDLLKKDFNVRTLYGAEGNKNWLRFLELKKEIKEKKDGTDPSTVEEYLRIGNDYGFPMADEIP